MKDAEWVDKYNENYLQLLKKHEGKENKHIYVNAGIVDWLVEHLTEAKRQYYIEGSDYMSDSRYDAYEEYLRVHDPAHPLLKKVGILK